MATYKDKNGVGWLIIQAADGSFLGTPDPSSERQYGDISTEAMDQTGNAEGAVAAAIEQFAARHKADLTQLRVTARPNGMVLLAILAGLLLWEARRRR